MLPVRAESPLLVLKFGGTSVGTPERILAVADRLARMKREGARLVVVVSAMGHTTDELLDLAHKISDNPHPREVDMLLTVGERISMALLSMALQDRGVQALSFTGSQTGIITSTHHRRARIHKILGDRVRQALDQDAIAIVAGFQGMSEAKEITTLGRGGSDTTAVALAAALQADRCDIYTDVDGVFSADPRIVPGARFLPRITHDQMVELARRGAGVLHPRSVELAQKYKVPLRVRSSLRGADGESQDPRDAGTEVVAPGDLMALATGMENSEVVGVTADPAKCLVEIHLMRATASGAVWDASARAGLALLCPFFSDTKWRFFVDRDALTDWQKVLQQLSVDGFVKEMQIYEDKTPLSVVGSRLTQDGSVLSKIFEILDQDAIPVTMGQASSLAMTFAIPAHRAKDAVSALHRGLIETGDSTT